ncbi:MAG: DUF1295 domain-containing protein [Marinilabiliaceae bacterium]|jgi:steroid 5-alpha reductase family enzyme|nr:DUF1295 domain-containing protein [Marinilabiliaceae bacterium]
MWKTIVFLLVTIIIIPFIAFRFDQGLSPEQLDILRELLTVYIIAASLCFMVSTLAKNYSQVDKLWSIIPLVYVWIISYRSGFEPRILLMAALVSLWGIRLSYNFSRRGGYSWKFWTGEEDYRWAVLRKKRELSGALRWHAFNLLFISFYQMGLILLITLPALKSIDGSPLSAVDFLLAALVLMFIVIETVADQQQWNYHKNKNQILSSGTSDEKEGIKGFIDTGLWGIVRHPNYSAEQAIWIIFYFFSVSATGSWLNWSLIGAILLVLLFWGSSNFSESVSSAKYSDYREYQKKVKRFIPFLW